MGRRPFSPSNTWFLEPTQAHNPNGISISSAVFARLTTVRNWLTDCATQSVTTGHIYVSSRAMRPNISKKNNNIKLLKTDKTRCVAVCLRTHCNIGSKRASCPLWVTLNRLISCQHFISDISRSICRHSLVAIVVINYWLLSLFKRAPSDKKALLTLLIYTD